MFLRRGGILLVAFVWLALHSAATQSNFPTRQITIVVPTAVSGAADGTVHTRASGDDQQ
jgi:tripartite-type tricarboxylate transporter receptor subunit TctC